MECMTLISSTTLERTIQQMHYHEDLITSDLHSRTYMMKQHYTGGISEWDPLEEMSFNNEGKVQAAFTVQSRRAWTSHVCANTAMKDKKPYNEPTESTLEMLLKKQ